MNVVEKDICGTALFANAIAVGIAQIQRHNFELIQASDEESHSFKICSTVLISVAMSVCLLSAPSDPFLGLSLALRSLLKINFI